jgi:hypothetical protein
MSGDIFRAWFDFKAWFDAWSLSDKIAVIASVVAFLQFIALIATVFVMRRTAKRQLRAYIGIAGIDIKKVTLNEKPVMTVLIKNFGQTPAYRVRHWVDCAVVTKGTIKFDLEAKSFSGEATLNPSDTYSVVCVMLEPLTFEQVENILNDVDRLFLVGDIRYRDAFGHRRKTSFRQETAGRDIIAMGRVQPSKIGNKST